MVAKRSIRMYDLVIPVNGVTLFNLQLEMELQRDVWTISHMIKLIHVGFRPCCSLARSWPKWQNSSHHDCNGHKYPLGASQSYWS